MRDASYLVTVPALVPDVPALQRDPVVAYLPALVAKGSTNLLLPDRLPRAIV